MTRAISPARTNKIIEGRNVWKSTNGNINERLHEFHKYHYSPEDGKSYTEMAFIIYAEQLNLDHRLDKQGLKRDELTDAELLRLHKYRTYTRHIYSMFNKWLENEGLILICEKNTETGDMIIYNVMLKDNIEDFSKCLKKEEDGIKRRIERITEIANKGRRRRVKATEDLSKVIELRIKRRNKKKYGDFGKGE